MSTGHGGFHESLILQIFKYVICDGTHNETNGNEIVGLGEDMGGEPHINGMRERTGQRN